MPITSLRERLTFLANPNFVPFYAYSRLTIRMHSISNADGERIGILEGITTQMQPNTVRGNLSALANEAKANPSAFAELINYYAQPVYRYLRFTGTCGLPNPNMSRYSIYRRDYN